MKLNLGPKFVAFLFSNPTISFKGGGLVASGLEKAKCGLVCKSNHTLGDKRAHIGTELFNIFCIKGCNSFCKNQASQGFKIGGKALELSPLEASWPCL